MKTARERAEAHLAAMANNTEFYWTDGDLDDLELLLKEQDKITRNACYDAVAITDLAELADDACVAIERAMEACMNVKAV